MPSLGWAARLRKAMARYGGLYLLILPAIAYVLIFSYVPMYGVQIAFRNYRTNKGIWGSDWVGLANIVRFFRYPYVWSLIRNTLTLSLYSLATFPCACVFALLLNEVRRPLLKKPIQMISYAPHFISTVVLCGMLLLFLKEDTGILNSLVALLGGERREWIGIPSAFPALYVWSGVWQNLGWNSIIYLAALSNVSPELLEAATLDGASTVQKIVHVNLPCILPTIVILLIMACGSLLSVGFEKVWLLQNALNIDASRVISTYVYSVGLENSEFSYSAAIGLFNNVVNVAILLLVNFTAKRVADISIW